MMNFKNASKDILKFLSLTIETSLFSSLSLAINFGVEVRNPQGATLQGVQVKVFIPNGSHVEGTTVGDGTARFGELPSGTYSVTVSKQEIIVNSGNFEVSQPDDSDFLYRVILRGVTLDELPQITSSDLNDMAVSIVQTAAKFYNPPLFYDTESSCEAASPGWECDPVTFNGTTKFIISHKAVSNNPSPPSPGSTPPPSPNPNFVDGAAFISQNVPGRMSTKGTYQVSVAMRNTGNTTWNSQCYRLGAQSPQDNSVFVSGARVSLGAGETVAPGATKSFIFNVTAPAFVGVYAFQWQMVNECKRWFGEASPYTVIQVQNSTQVVDVDGDKKTDLMVWRASTSTWYYTTSSSSFTGGDSKLYGGAGDVPLTGDFDGDGLSDLIIWRGSTGYWYWLKSSSSYTTEGIRQFGTNTLGDIPLVGDIDGDGKDDIAVWRASTGTFYWLTSASGFTAGNSINWGGQGDTPMLSDMDGDGKADFVVWRGSTGYWYWLTSSSNYTSGLSKQFGSNSVGDIPLLGDVDGDSKADIIVWRSSTGNWYWTTSSSNYINGDSRQWGTGTLGDIPKLGDFDGDGKVDFTVWRATTGTWYWLNSGGGYTGANAGSKQWGSKAYGDIPLLR